MAGTRLLAQLSFVACVLAIFIYSMFLLNLHRYWQSPILSFLTSQHKYPTTHPNKYTTWEYYANLSSATLDEEKDSSFWAEVASTVDAIENDQTPPTTELRINLILASDDDEDEEDEDCGGEEEERDVGVRGSLELLAFSMETQLLLVHSLLPKVDIRILEYPHCNLNQAIQSANMSSSDTLTSPSFTLTKSSLLHLHNQRNGFNFDYLQRTGLEPACVGACKQVFVVMYRPSRAQQPLHVGSQGGKGYHNDDASSSTSKVYSEKVSGLVMNQNLVVMAFNDADFQESVNTFVEKIATFVMTKFLYPLLFPQSNSVTDSLRNSTWSSVFLSSSGMKRHLISRIIHFQRSIAQVLQHIVSLEERDDYYLHIQRDGPLFSALVDATRAQDWVEACLEGNEHNKSNSDPASEGTQGLSNITEPSSFIERLQCAHTSLITASTLLEDIFTSPNMLSDVREDYEFLLALAVPYWVPILIPVVYGTVIEIQRYRTKTSLHVTLSSS
jgi:hypothetical protein